MTTMPVTRNQSNASNTRQSNDSAETSAPKETTDRGETSTESDPPRRDSPDNCSICLGPFNNKSFTSSCAHSFCFICLKQWSKVKAECPLCKQPFTSIFHNIRSNDSYDIYELPPLNPPRQIDYSFYNYVGGNLTAFPPSHQYFNFSQPTLDADLTLSNFSRFQFRHRRYDRFLNPHQLPVHGEHQYSYTSSSVTSSTHVSAATWARGAEDFRRQVYRHHMGPPSFILGYENSTYRLTPAMVTASAHRLHRIMPWLTRELRVLLRSHQNVRLAISIIQPLLTQVTIDSYYFSERVSPLIGLKSRQFIQEFVAFANSALTMQAFDRKAMYRRQVVSYTEDTSSSSEEDEVVEVSDVSPDTQDQSTRSVSASNSTSIQRNGWDSPTPGPSWESVDSHVQIDIDRVSVSSESDDPVFRPDLNDSDSDNSKPGSDIVFVKYDKPWNERSPIQLSSDTDGENKSKKRRKSKHKKRHKESSDTAIELGKKGKGHKSSKVRSKDKVRGKPRASSVEDLQHGSDLSSLNKKTNSASSSEKRKRKKHKKSRDKYELTAGQTKDRELVDRLFVEAFSLQQNKSSACGSGDSEIPSSSRLKESSRKSKLYDKEKSRKKKKKRNLSRSSTSTSTQPPYKKHHSGHKKSSEQNNQNQELVRQRNQSKLSSRDLSTEHNSQTGSFERDLHSSRNQHLSHSNLSHSMTNTFQTSYMSIPDTVQHIPLNLWVSAWPSLPVSHTFPTPPSSSFPPPPLPHAASSSTVPLNTVNHSTREQSSSVLDSQTISSESSSESDSDDSQGDSNSHPNSVRTKQWLEANFLAPEKQQPTSSHAKSEFSGGSHIARDWDIDLLMAKDSDFSISCKKPMNVADVVSVASDDDIVVCSSSSSVKSYSDEITVIEMSTDNILENSSAHSSSKKLGEQTGGSTASSSKQEKSVACQSLTGRASTPQACNIFQPFKLQKKSALTKPLVDPLFSALTQSSDDDTIDDACRLLSPKSQSTLQKKVENVEKSQNNTKCVLRTSSTTCDCSTNVAPTEESVLLQQNSVSDSVRSADGQITVPSTSTTLSGENKEYCEKSELRPTITSSFSSITSSGSTMYDVLPTPDAPVTSIMSSNLNYLPYSSLPVSSPLSSLLPQTLSYSAPPPYFPFPPIPSLLQSPSSVFSPVYPAYSQSSQMAASASCSVLTSKEPKRSYSSLLTNSTLTMKNKSTEKLEFNSTGSCNALPGAQENSISYADCENDMDHRKFSVNNSVTDADKSRVETANDFGASDHQQNLQLINKTDSVTNMVHLDVVEADHSTPSESNLSGTVEHNGNKENTGQENITDMSNDFSPFAQSSSIESH